MNSNIRNRVIFSDQLPIHLVSFLNDGSKTANNFIWPTNHIDLKWIQETTEIFGNLRALVRSTYIKWATTINALYIAEKRYNSEPDTGLEIHTMRPYKGELREVVMATWDGKTASDRYKSFIPLISSYAVQDLYGALEHIEMEIHTIFIKSHPDQLMVGNEYKELRRLYRNKDNNLKSKEEFNVAWNNRLRKWKEKHTFKSLQHKFSSYWKKAKLQKPLEAQDFDLDQLKNSIKVLSELRNLITHNEGTVSSKLSMLCKECPLMDLGYETGDALNVSVHQLMYIESFMDLLLTFLNLSLCELGERESNKKI